MFGGSWLPDVVDLGMVGGSSPPPPPVPDVDRESALAIYRLAVHTLKTEFKLQPNALKSMTQAMQLLGLTPADLDTDLGVVKT
jgi:hypothetical protein